MVKKSLIIWAIMSFVLLNSQNILLGKQKNELSKQKAKEYLADNNKHYQRLNGTKSNASDSTMDIIMWYDCDNGTLINTRSDNGWNPLNPGYPKDPAAGGIEYNNYIYLKRASDGAILAASRPPESYKFTSEYWHLSQYVGTDVYIEIVDSNSESSSASIAADDFIIGNDTLNFESGAYAPNWQVISGTAFGTAPSSSLHGGMSGQEGKYWADSFSGGGNSAIGVLRSKTFTLTSSTISFLKAGYDGKGGTGPWRTTTSLLGTYESQDSTVIKQHAYWITALGCNVLASDLTNSASIRQPDVSSDMLRYHGGVNKAFELQLKYLAKITEFEAPTAYPVIRLYGTDYDNLSLMLDDMYSLYQQYPDKWYKLNDGTSSKDKPFIEIFADWSVLNTWAQSGIPAQLQDVRFNIRWSNGYLLGQSAITKRDNNGIYKIPGSIPYWLFVENTQKTSGYYEPVYKELPDSNGVEQMITWASVCISGSEWDGLRDTVDGKTTLVRYTQPVFNLKPKALMACRFNYAIAWLTQPQEGVSRNKSTHIEPNVDWGFLEFNDVADELYSVRNYVKTVPPTPTLESFDTVSSVLNIKLDGFPLEYRISNKENLDDAAWTFLNVGKGGINLSSAINLKKIVYIQTRNSFGQSPIGTFQHLTSVRKENNGIPASFELSQNYPNPFNPTTQINYSIPKSGIVTLKVYNILGQEITTLINRQQEPGNYTVDFDASRLASGLYIYRIQCGGLSLTKKMTLLK